MVEQNLFCYPYASFTNAQLPLLKVAALYFDKLVLLDPVGASWADHRRGSAHPRGGQDDQGRRYLADVDAGEIPTPATGAIWREYCCHRQYH